MAGRAYANVAGNTVVQYAVKQQPQLQLSYLHSTSIVPALGAAQELQGAAGRMRTQSSALKKDGTIAAMHEKWFGTKPASGSAAVTIFAGHGRTRHARLRSSPARGHVRLTGALRLGAQPGGAF